MVKNYLETENLIFRFSDLYKEFAVYKKTDDALCLMKTAPFMSALIAGMKISCDGIYRAEIETALAAEKL